MVSLLVGSFSNRGTRATPDLRIQFPQSLIFDNCAGPRSSDILAAGID
jgi:hypothetical protein